MVRIHHGPPFAPLRSLSVRRSDFRPSARRARRSAARRSRASKPRFTHHGPPFAPLRSLMACRSDFRPAPRRRGRSAARHWRASNSRFAHHGPPFSLLLLSAAPGVRALPPPSVRAARGTDEAVRRPTAPSRVHPHISRRPHSVGAPRDARGWTSAAPKGAALLRPLSEGSVPVLHSTSRNARLPSRMATAPPCSRPRSPYGPPC